MTLQVLKLTLGTLLLSLEELEMKLKIDYLAIIALNQSATFSA